MHLVMYVHVFTICVHACAYVFVQSTGRFVYEYSIHVHSYSLAFHVGWWPRSQTTKQAWESIVQARQLHVCLGAYLSPDEVFMSTTYQNKPAAGEGNRLLAAGHKHPATAPYTSGY